MPSIPERKQFNSQDPLIIPRDNFFEGGKEIVPVILERRENPKDPESDLEYKYTRVKKLHPSPEDPQKWTGSDTQVWLYKDETAHYATGYRQTDYVLKIIKIPVIRSKDEWHMKQWNNETQCILDLNEEDLNKEIVPNIIKCERTFFFTYEGSQHEYHAIVMEHFADGNTLRKVIDEERKGNRNLEIEVVKKIIISILSAVKGIHKRGMAHCDLKPNNILLDYSHEDRRNFLGYDSHRVLRVIDFNTACLPTDKQRNIIEGISKPYRHPEQKCHKKAEHYFDVHAIGVILLELLGCNPCEHGEPDYIYYSEDETSFMAYFFDDDTETTGYEKQLDFDPDQAAKEIFYDILKNALAFNKTIRNDAHYDNAGEMLDHLNKALDNFQKSQQNPTKFSLDKYKFSKWFTFFLPKKKENGGDKREGNKKGEKKGEKDPSGGAKPTIMAGPIRQIEIERDEAIKRAEKLTEEVASLRQSLKSEEQRREDVEKRLHDTLDERTSLRQSLSGAHEQRDIAVNEREQVIKKAEQLTKEVVSLHQSLKSEVQRREVVEKQLHDTLNERTSLRQSLTEAYKQRDDAVNERGQVIKKAEQLTKEVTSLRQSLTESEKQRNKVINERKENLKDYNNLVDRFNNLLNEYKKLLGTSRNNNDKLIIKSTKVKKRTIFTEGGCIVTIEVICYIVGTFFLFISFLSLYYEESLPYFLVMLFSSLIPFAGLSLAAKKKSGLVRILLVLSILAIPLAFDDVPFWLCSKLPVANNLNPKFYYFRGIKHLKQEEYDSAISEFLKISDYQRDYHQRKTGSTSKHNITYMADVCYNMGIAYICKADFNSAFTHFDEAVKLAETGSNIPNAALSDFLNNLGVARLYMGNKKSAIADFEKAIKKATIDNDSLPDTDRLEVIKKNLAYANGKISGSKFSPILAGMHDAP